MFIDQLRQIAASVIAKLLWRQFFLIAVLNDHIQFGLLLSTAVRQETSTSTRNEKYFIDIAEVGIPGKNFFAAL